MTGKTQIMKMPELLVFARVVAGGFISAETFRVCYYLATNFAPTISDFGLWANVAVVSAGLALCLIYSIKRGAYSAMVRMGQSLRLDLLIAIAIGAWANELASHWLTRVHDTLKNTDSEWALVVTVLLCTILLSPIVQHQRRQNTKTASQIHFISDEEISDENVDVLDSRTQAKSFAETVLASSEQSGLVFGVDGPWGVGKTSFLNLAEQHWSIVPNGPIVCRFEPLRYATEPDLSERLIRDLSAAIQRTVFAPEFQPAASRYSRLIKGKADISFLGFKISLEPSKETVDELLDDIDEVLRRIGRRVIIVIDDLDRLDAKTTNNVLFATRQTFKLSRATYVLCYDTEVLAGSQEDSSRAREFLEKFVTVKLSLFIDSSSIKNFLLRDWQRAESQLSSIPADTMLKLGTVLSELAKILDSDLATNYLSLVGDLRKVKRFVNTMLLMQIDKCDLGKTDFNNRDLINLILLHLNYPGLFRQIYAEETDGRSGSFSVCKKYGEREFKNTPEFIKTQEQHPGTAGFLISQLFDVSSLNLNAQHGEDEAVLRSRACFNHGPWRNLEGYLKLIVRFATPEPQETFVLYQKAVEKVRKGTSVCSVLTSTDFRLELGERAHNQFWTLLVNQSHDFTAAVAEDAIETLVNYLPNYSAFANTDLGLRQRSIYSLLQLLDRAGWGKTSGRHPPNTADNVIEIAWRIFGEDRYEGKGILQRLASSERGILGWNDLMLFRLQCSADRQGQLYNLHSALIVHQDPNGERIGLLNILALNEMREMSQAVFSLFKTTYIHSQRNFFSEVRDALTSEFHGISSSNFTHQSSSVEQSERDFDSLDLLVCSTRSDIKSFVIYQMSNPHPPNGSGVGCGYYDEYGKGDFGGIAMRMNEYVFGVCFNPDIDNDNILHFLDYCLSHLSTAFFMGRDERAYLASKSDIAGGLNPKEMGRYWCQHQEIIRQKSTQVNTRKVFTHNYIASYGEDLAGVFAVLDELANDVKNAEAEAEAETVTDLPGLHTRLAQAAQ